MTSGQTDGAVQLLGKINNPRFDFASNELHGSRADC